MKVSTHALSGFLGLLMISAGLSACPSSPRQETTVESGIELQAVASAHSSPPAGDFKKVGDIMTHSCMPCHNKSYLSQVINRVKVADFKEIDGDTRLRILAELEELQGFMDEGMPISFTSEEQVQKFMQAAPGELYLMLEKSVMPPPWAEELMKQINWPSYTPLSWENRIEILRYAKPYSQQYLR